METLGDFKLIVVVLILLGSSMETSINFKGVGNKDCVAVGE